MNVRTGLIVLTVLSVMAFAIPCQVGAAAIVKIGIVDLQEALNKTTEGMAAKESLRQRHTGRQEEIDAKKAELDSMEEKLKSPILRSFIVDFDDPLCQIQSFHGIDDSAAAFLHDDGKIILLADIPCDLDEPVEDPA